MTWRLMITKLASKSQEFARFAVGQQCAAEGFSLFLQSIEEHPNIERLFTHRRRNSFHCPDCKECFSIVEETNNMFEVDIDETGEIKDKKNLNEFLLNQKNNIDADCLCSKCNVRSEKIKISSLIMVPVILFVMSKKYMFKNGQGRKLVVNTDFPEHLVFKSRTGAEFKYSAVSMIQHYGGLNGGHYTAICKRLGKWYCINDNMVSPATFRPDSNTYIVVYHFM